eukprot:gene15536-18414_t
MPPILANLLPNRFWYLLQGALQVLFYVGVSAQRRHMDVLRPYTGPSYSNDLSTRLVWMAEASYCSQERISSWSCGQACTTVDNFSPVAYFSDPEQHLQGYLGVDRSQMLGNSTSLIVVFRGTNGADIPNWIDNIDIWSVAPYPDLPDVYVHRGFHLGYTSKMRAQILEALQLYPVDMPLYVVGHSMGGALALNCAFDLVHSHHRNVQAVFTYGQPRTGNKQFADAVAAYIPALFRVTHDDDIVPHVPTQWMVKPQNGTFNRKLLLANSLSDFEGYRHAATEVYYPDSTLNYKICDGSGEDSTCSNSCLLCTSVNDHLHYLDIHIGGYSCVSEEEVAPHSS